MVYFFSKIYSLPAPRTAEKAYCLSHTQNHGLPWLRTEGQFMQVVRWQRLAERISCGGSGGSGAVAAPSAAMACSTIAANCCIPSAVG